MKKVICILLATMMLMSILFIPVYAQEIEDSEYLYEDAFVEQYVSDTETPWEYKEVYYYYGDSNNVEWCLVYATASSKATGVAVYLKFADFVLVSSDIIRPFILKYAVYDVEKNRFFDLVDIYDDVSNYDGLIDVLRTLKESVILGDTDDDNIITVIDATKIQRDIAQLETLYDHYSDRRGVRGRFSDYNNDGETTIIDATAIQKMLAGLE